ncbi:MAG: efflux RND transporter periplasmic adaptor subunit [Verrucomicrobiota bacterium]
MKILTRIVVPLLVVAAIAGGAWFYLKPSASSSAPGDTAAASAPAKPALAVGVQTLNEQDVRLWSEFSGRMHAVDYAEIRPEVSGRITEIHFQDGQYVNAGDVLYVIDPRPYAAIVERDEASLASAKARIVLAQLDLQRAQNLIDSHAIAQSDLDQRSSTLAVAQADADNAAAQIKQAKVDLEHCTITAPISGRVSRAEVTLGNVVQSVESGLSTPVLTTIVSRDGIYADFEVDEQTYLDTIRSGAVGNAQEQKIPVQLVVRGDTGHVYSGYMQSFDNRIDPSSGTIRARAKFPNGDGALVPGMFVSVRLAASEPSRVLLVPDRAVGFDQSKKFVYVVDGDSKVSYREVALGKTVGKSRVVEDGLKAGDRVIVDGIQQVRPNDVVDVREVAADALPNDAQQVANK